MVGRRPLVLGVAALARRRSRRSSPTLQACADPQSGQRLKPIGDPARVRGVDAGDAVRLGLGSPLMCYPMAVRSG
jgi:hypothetical protein